MGAEGIAKVVKAHRPNLGAIERLLEALAHARCDEWPAGVRVAKDEVLVVLEDGCFEVALNKRTEVSVLTRVRVDHCCPTTPEVSAVRPT